MELSPLWSPGSCINIYSDLPTLIMVGGILLDMASRFKIQEVSVDDHELRYKIARYLMTML
jgi:hypothetical protein